MIVAIMYRTALRSGSRPALSGLRTSAVRAAPRRFASTASPADKPRSWKGSAVRWGLAVGAVYYYSTSPVFADEAPTPHVNAPAPFATDDLPTVESIVEEKRKQIKDKLERQAPKREPTQAERQPAPTESPDAATTAASPAALEEEAGQQGAFNPETGEINWDCPCLGGMATGPCGEEFKSAFSCFVYSEAEPKGMDCIDKFQGMQECFRKYPEIYGGELTDDDDETDAPEVGIAEDHQTLRENLSESAANVAEEEKPFVEKAASDAFPPPKPESTEIPQKWDDATAANEEVKAEEEQKPQEKKE
ncbi:mitochondrial intermembrane space import and assembly protein [Paramyrothecium foliicola]|nr:mitochondrial intermembrane space import and assembly protein [Paramyrothecium foliicola]